MSQYPSPVSPPLRKLAVALLAVGGVAAIGAVSAYVWNFAPASGYSIASGDAAWSNFGSYLGGVLGPAFSFLAFLGVLLTVWLQAQQLDITRNQANLEEVQRVVSSLSTRIDELLALNSSRLLRHSRFRDDPITVFSAISGAGTAALTKPDSFISEASRDQLIREVLDHFSGPLTAIGLELDHLTWCLRQYEDGGGSAIVRKYYFRRYLALVVWLHALGLVSSHVEVQRFFDPEANRWLLEPGADRRDI